MGQLRTNLELEHTTYQIDGGGCIEKNSQYFGGRMVWWLESELSPGRNDPATLLR